MSYLKLIDFLKSGVCVPFNKHIKEEIEHEIIITVSNGGFFRYIDDLGIWEFIYLLKTASIELEDTELYLMMGAFIGLQSNFSIGDIKYKFKREDKTVEVYYSTVFSKEIIEDFKKLSYILSDIAEELNIIEDLNKFNVINSNTNNSNNNNANLGLKKTEDIEGFNISKLANLINNLKPPTKEQEDEDEDENENENEDEEKNEDDRK